jgi:hypothetical protein
MKSILDSSFRYIPSFDTDLEKTFARIRSEHRKDAEGAAQGQARQPQRQRTAQRPTSQLE